MTSAFDAAHELHKRGELEAAARGYEAILASEPGAYAAVYYLSLLRAQQGDLERAESLASAAVEIDEGSAEAHAQLGAVLLAAERHGDAIAHLRRAIALRPDLAAPYNNLGAAYYTLGMREEAVACYRRAVEIDPRFSDAHNNLGSALRELGRFDDALEHFERAPELRPKNASAHGDLAFALLEMGRLHEAAAEFEKAIELAPDKPNFYRALATIRPFEAESPHVAALEGLAAGAQALDPEARMHLGFALAKVYEGLGRQEDSFRHLLAATAEKRRTIEYDEADALASFRNIAGVFNRERMRSFEGLGYPAEGPVFVLGMPRSGSTLVEQILASHPNVHAGGELSYFEEAVDAVFTRSGAPLDGEHLAELGKTYAARIRALAPFAARITDKMPGNFRFAGLIALALPKAKILHTRRDPVDNCLSCFSIIFQEGQEFTYDLAELGRYYRGYEALADHWRSVIPADAWLDVQYEDVIDDVETQARRIVEHCGLPWTSACLAFHQTKRPVQTASASQVRKPIYRSSVGRWRPYAHLLEPLLDALGISAPPHLL